MLLFKHVLSTTTRDHLKDCVQFEFLKRLFSVKLINCDCVCPVEKLCSKSSVILPLGINLVYTHSGEHLGTNTGFLTQSDPGFSFCSNTDS